MKFLATLALLLPLSSTAASLLILTLPMHAVTQAPPSTLTVGTLTLP